VIKLILIILIRENLHKFNYKIKYNRILCVGAWESPKGNLNY